MRKLVLAALLLASCAKRAPLKPVEYHGSFAVTRETQTIQGDTVFVSVYGPEGEREAKEYLCTKTYVCVREDLPVHVFKLTRVRK